MTLGQFEPHASDLAPGDRGVLDSPWSSFSIERVTSASDPLFETVYRRLWREFGKRGEMERRSVIAERLAWDPRRPQGSYALMYELLVVRDGDDIVAIRDHSVILSLPLRGASAGGAGRADDMVVHLSHVLVEPEMRGRGVAAWLRALPIASARRCWELARGVASPTTWPTTSPTTWPTTWPSMPPLTLVAEMEADDGSDAVRRRLRSYARAGFRMVDPALVRYFQPDFRDAADIDAGALAPVPLCLVVRRVGREHENSIDPAALRSIVHALYAMFGVHVRSDHLAGARELLLLPEDASEGEAQIPLVVPGFAPPADRRVIR